YGEDGKKRRNKKNLTLLDTRDINLHTLGLSPSAKVAGWARKGWRNWKRTLGLPLLILAVVLLAAGLLWQNNRLGTFASNRSESSGGKQELKIPIKEHPAPPAPPAADVAKNKAAGSGEPQALPRLHETTLQRFSEERKLTNVVPPKEEAPVPAPTTPLTEAKEEVPVARMDNESAGLNKGEMLPNAVAVPVTEPNTLSLRKTTYPYSLFLSSVPDIGLAKGTISQWSKRGFAPYYAKVVFSQGEQYWIYVGCFESKEKAEIFKKQNELAGATIRNTPYANMVGVYESLEELQRQYQKLKELGYSSYAVAEPQGKYRLLVGAFSQKERAQRQHEELKSKGIENQIVQR
ncbi:MAG: Sporulation related domain, partial [Deltaproteobacteria bacterium]|nr:Sporulation related domain [Deltaproteobacteria bacterium]